MARSLPGLHRADSRARAEGCQNRPMLLPGETLFAVSKNRGMAYDSVLLVHVLAAFAGFGVVGVAGIYALLLRRDGPRSEAVARYYRPGVNWAGRTIFLVPVLGATLIAMSSGAWSYRDLWIEIGLTAWTVAAVLGEVVLWPAERRLQRLAADPAADRVTLVRTTRTVALASATMVVIFLFTAVVMVAKP